MHNCRHKKNIRSQLFECTYIYYLLSTPVHVQLLAEYLYKIFMKNFHEDGTLTNQFVEK